MKYRIACRLGKFLQSLKIAFYILLSTNKSKDKFITNQPVLMLGNGSIEFDANVNLGFFPSPYFFNGYIHLETRNKLSVIKIGKDTHINNNFVAICEYKNITIGQRCLIGTNVEIFDSDFHGIKVSERRISPQDATKSVLIGDDVFIGSNVKILNGSIIGSGSVIANGSIVVGEIPANVIAGGNPAKVIRMIDQ